MQQYLPLLPFAIEQVDLGAAELVISSSHLVAKGVLTAPASCTLVMCIRPFVTPGTRCTLICSVPSWPAWSGPFDSLAVACSAAMGPTRCPAGGSPHCQLRFTARRIRKYWGREASVIHPRGGGAFSLECRSRRRLPLSVPFGPLQAGGSCGGSFQPLGPTPACGGDGPERSRLEVLAGPTVTLLGRQSQQQVEELMARCRAFVYAGLEDFGIAPVEAMASGAPVIGLGRGGLLDTVRCASSGLRTPLGCCSRNKASSRWCRPWTGLNKNGFEFFGSESIRGWAERFRPKAFAAPLNRLCEQPGAPISGAVPLQRVTLRRCRAAPVTLSVVSPTLAFDLGLPAILDSVRRAWSSPWQVQAVPCTDLSPAICSVDRH